MKAAQISEYGDPSVVQVNEADKPVIKSNQVLVEVHAASLNPWDTTVRSGKAKDSMPLQFPATLGGDIAGLVVELGEDTSGLALGDRVYGEAGLTGGSGGFAEFAAAKAELLAKLPDGFEFQEAAALALTGVSAIQALEEHLKIQSGQKILIHGGAGGIGSLAVQLAKHIGAHVISTAGTEDLEFVRQLGADEVIDYKTQKFEELLSDLDAVFDTVGGETRDKSFKVLKKGGVIVSMLGGNDELAKQYGVTSIGQVTHASTAKLEKLAKLANDGVLKVQIEKVFPLEQIQEAFKTRETGNIRGKIVISIK